VGNRVHETWDTAKEGLAAGTAPSARRQLARHGVTTHGEGGARRAKWEPQARPLLARERGAPPVPVVYLVCVCVCVCVCLCVCVYYTYMCIVYLCSTHLTLGAVPVPITRPTNIPPLPHPLPVCCIACCGSCGADRRVPPSFPSSPFVLALHSRNPPAVGALRRT
jgi:hypothetical protein